MSNAFWDERYSEAGFAYGDKPNEFLAETAAQLPKRGTALDIGAGEGRNALFLASLGLTVTAVDQSQVGMRKAEETAKSRGLELRTQAADLREFDAPAGAFDVVSSIFVHLPTDLRVQVHGRLSSWLRPGGMFVLEAYAPDQLQRGTGGPKDPNMLASLEALVAELKGLEIVSSRATLREVREGRYHTGEASVIQIVARKPRG